MQLVINTFGAALRKQGDRFSGRAGDRELSFSAHKVQSILVATGVSLTSNALQLAAEHNVDVVFLDRWGDPYGRFWQNRLGSTVAIRRRQLEPADGPEGLELVRGWVEAKLRHQLEFLEELAARRPGAEADFQNARAGIRDCLERVGGLTGSLDERRATVMGLEGAAGRAYFGVLGRLVPEAYRFTGRSRQPAQDGFNAMLNYTYGVLYSVAETARPRKQGSERAATRSIPSRPCPPVGVGQRSGIQQNKHQIPCVFSRASSENPSTRFLRRTFGGKKCWDSLKL
jgi:CRISPR-associated protein Cas1